MLAAPTPAPSPASTCFDLPAANLMTSRKRDCRRLRDPDTIAPAAALWLDLLVRCAPVGPSSAAHALTIQ